MNQEFDSAPSESASKIERSESVHDMNLRLPKFRPGDAESDLAFIQMKRHSYKLEPWQGMNFALDADSDVRTEKCDSTSNCSSIKSV